jgi:hypothetical protein
MDYYFDCSSYNRHYTVTKGSFCNNSNRSCNNRTTTAWTAQHILFVNANSNKIVKKQYEIKIIVIEDFNIFTADETKEDITKGKLIIKNAKFQQPKVFLSPS